MEHRVQVGNDKFCYYSFIVLKPSPSSLGSNHGQRRCVELVFLGKTLYSHSASLLLCVKMGTGKFNAVGNPVTD